MFYFPLHISRTLISLMKSSLRVVCSQIYLDERKISNQGGGGQNACRHFHIVILQWRLAGGMVPCVRIFKVTLELFICIFLLPLKNKTKQKFKSQTGEIF